MKQEQDVGLSHKRANIRKISQWEWVWCMVFALFMGCLQVRFRRLLLRWFAMVIFVYPLMLSLVVSLPFASHPGNSQPSIFYTEVASKMLLLNGFSPNAVEVFVDKEEHVIQGRFCPPQRIVLSAGAVNQLSKAELTAVIAHELGHWQIFHEQAMPRLFLFVKKNTQVWSMLLPEPASKGLRQLSQFVLSFLSRRQEFMADKKGLQLILTAGEPLEGLPIFFLRTMTVEEEVWDEFATHPPTKERFDQVLQSLTEYSRGQIEIRDSDLFLNGEHFVAAEGAEVFSRYRILKLAAPIVRMAVQQDLSIQTGCKFPVALSVEEPLSQDMKVLACVVSTKTEPQPASENHRLFP